MLNKVKKIYINNSGAVNVEEDMSFNQGDKNVSYIQINGIDISILTQAKIKTPAGQIITKNAFTPAGIPHTCNIDVLWSLLKNFNSSSLVSISPLFMFIRICFTFFNMLYLL